MRSTTIDNLYIGSTHRDVYNTNGDLRIKVDSEPLDMYPKIDVKNFHFVTAGIRTHVSRSISRRLNLIFDV